MTGNIFMIMAENQLRGYAVCSDYMFQCSRSDEERQV